MADLRNHTGELVGNSRITLSRREFLRLSGASAATVALGGGLGWLLSSCSNGPTTTTASLPATTALSTTTGGAASLYPVSVDGKWGFIDKTGTVVVKPQFAWAGDFSEGVAAVGVTANDVTRYGWVDTSGTIVIQPQFYGPQDLWPQPFSEGLAAVKTEPGDDAPFGFIDKTGTLVIPTRYKYVSNFSEGLCSVMIEKDGQQLFGYIDKTGAYVLEPQYEFAEDFSEGLAHVEISGTSAIIDQKGNRALQLPSGMKAPAVGFAFSEGLAVVEELGALARRPRGYIDKTGTVVIKPQFDQTNNFSEGLAAVGITENEVTKWGYIDKTGAWVIQPLFDTAAAFAEGLAEVGTVIPGKSGDSSGKLAFSFIDKSGKVVIKMQQDQGPGGDRLGFSGGVARFDIVTNVGTSLVPDSMTYIDTTGKVIWPKR